MGRKKGTGEFDVRISLFLSQKQFDFLEELSKEYYHGNNSKAIRALLDRVMSLEE